MSQTGMRMRRRGKGRTSGSKDSTETSDEGVVVGDSMVDVSHVDLYERESDAR